MGQFWFVVFFCDFKRNFVFGVCGCVFGSPVVLNSLAQKKFLASGRNGGIPALRSLIAKIHLLQEETLGEILYVGVAESTYFN